MKIESLTAVAVFILSLPAAAQDIPQRIEVGSEKTVHILFPAAVRYVDLGSPNIVAAKADGAENVVRIKAAVPGFEGETNFTVITDDGGFYTFDAVYSDNPSRISLRIEDALRSEPFSQETEYKRYVQLSELGDESPLTVERIMRIIYSMDATHIRNVGVRSEGMQLLLKGIYVYGNLIFMDVELRNGSKIGYEVDYSRFRIASRKAARRTAEQETVMEPVRTFGETLSVGPGRNCRSIFAFQKFTVPTDKVFIMDVYEKNGTRRLSFTVRSSDFAASRPIEKYLFE